jgi:hypothetical protein
MNTCTICCDEVVSFIECLFCKFKACELCNQKFISERPREPICMNCGKIWSREFVLKNIENKQWFFKHIGKYIVEQEKMLLPETQEEAFLVSQIQDISKQIYCLPTNSKLTRLYNHLGDETLKEIIDKKRVQKHELTKYMNELKSQTITYKPNNILIRKKRINYIFKCPRDCRGFISDNYQCGTCKLNVCDKCSSKIDEDNHKCREDDIKTSELILKMSKPCPKCMTLIIKSGGCDQMFCTQCNTAFSWITGEIETGVIHNPHYYEYLGTLKDSGNIDVLACGEIPNVQTFIVKIRHLTVDNDLRKKLSEMYRYIDHIRETILPHYHNDKVKDNIDIRIKYLLNEFDCSTWENKLMNREKKRMKIKAFYDLLQLVIIIIEDFVRQVFSLKNDEFFYNNAFNILRQMESLKYYYDETLETICCVHGGMIPLKLSNAFL